MINSYSNQSTLGLNKGFHYKKDLNILDLLLYSSLHIVSCILNLISIKNYILDLASLRTVLSIIINHRFEGLLHDYNYFFFKVPDHDKAYYLHISPLESSSQ